MPSSNPTSVTVCQASTASPRVRARRRSDASRPGSVASSSVSSSDRLRTGASCSRRTRPIAARDVSGTGAEQQALDRPAARRYEPRLADPVDVDRLHELPRFGFAERRARKGRPRRGEGCPTHLRRHLGPDRARAPRPPRIRARLPRRRGGARRAPPRAPRDRRPRPPRARARCARLADRSGGAREARRRWRLASAIPAIRRSTPRRSATSNRYVAASREAARVRSTSASAAPARRLRASPRGRDRTHVSLQARTR